MKPHAVPIPFDFNRQLPEGREWFSVRWLARHFNKSPQHFINLIESGELAESLDLRGPKAKRADRIVHRKVLVAFLVKRRKIS